MTAPRPRLIAPAIFITLALAACTAASPSPSVSAIPSTAASTSAAPSVEPSVEPSDDLGEFACSFPVTGVGTMGRAHITDVRVGSHDGYDRVVFQFDDGIPQFNLEEATPPLLADASGLEIDVEGEAFWRLVMHGGTAVTPDGVETYDGPTDFMRDFPKLAELVSGGDFEAVSTWYFGLTEASCVRVLTLTDPSRLVIDIEH